MLAYQPSGVLTTFPDHDVHIFGTSSDGNSTYLPNCHILIDLGFPKHTYLDYDPTIFYKITHVLLTHRHQDHLNKATFKYLINTYPHLTFVMSSDVADALTITTPNRCLISKPVTVFHQPCYHFTTKYCDIVAFPTHHGDVINRGYYITNLVTHQRYLYATDFNHADDLLPINVDTALLEANYDPQKLTAIQNDLMSSNGLLAHSRGCLRHLDEPHAWEYIHQHVKQIFIPMHASHIFGSLIQSQTEESK